MDTKSAAGRAVPRALRGGSGRQPTTAGATAADSSDVSRTTTGHVAGDDRWRLDRGTALLLLTAGTLGAGLMWVMHKAIIDDGYISLVYARTLADHFQWGMLPGTPANTATSPLNVMILAAVTVVVRSPMTALWLVTIVNTMVLSVGLQQLGTQWRAGRWFAWAGLSVLVLNPVLASSIGLETMMAVTLLVWLIARAGAGDWRTFGWLCGVGAVLRPDVVVVVAVVWLLHPALRRPRWLQASVGVAWRAALVAAPWYVFSWVHFGTAIPDTLAIKQQQTWGHYASGLWQRYGDFYPAATYGSLLLAGVGGLGLLLLPAFLSSRHRPVLLSVATAGLAGLAYYGVYCKLGVPPYPWYYGIPLAGLSLVAAWLIAVVAQLVLRETGQRAVFALTAVLTAAALSLALVSWGENLARHRPLREAPVHGNWALTPQYRQIGLDLAKRFPNDPVIRSAGEFGTILYYCRCNILDRFDNRSLIMDRLIKQRDSSWLMGLNYLFLKPSDYPLVHQDFHLLYGRHHVKDPRSWNVFSPTKGLGHYTVVKGPRPADVAEGTAR